MKKLSLVALMLAALPAYASETCIAIRGNGELMPAHWGALARTVEVFGTPRGIAGGSSGSLSAFLLESILLNPMLKDRNQLKGELFSKRLDERVAYLLKSIQGIVENTAERDEFKVLKETIGKLKLAAEAQKDPKSGVSKQIQAILANPEVAFAAILAGNKDAEEITKALNLFMSTDLFFGPLVQETFKTFQTVKAASTDAEKATQGQILAIQVEILKKSFEVLGSFDAENDPALIVRPGVLNFRALGVLFGKMANFYAQVGLREGSTFRKDFEKHVTACAPKTTNLLWSHDSLIGCRKEFSDLVNVYFEEAKGITPAQERINQPIGSSKEFTVLVSTAIATGKSVGILSNLQNNFLKDGKTLPLNTIKIDGKEIKFGYWGADAQLKQLASVLTPKTKSTLEWVNTDKSSRFKALNTATWIEALERSPAEPGLASFIPYGVKSVVNGKEVVENTLSLGGWSDLHPTLVLKALGPNFGCSKIIYVTRRGGDSPFGQGVAKRLFNMSDADIPWSRLNPKLEESQKMNSLGVADPKGKTPTQWSSMYNLANRTSSFSQSLLNADAVVCTDWNQFDVKVDGDFHKMISQAYNDAQIFNRSDVAMTSTLAAKPFKLPAKVITNPTPNEATWSGCLPNSL